MAYTTLERAKKHLNIEPDFTDDDEYITSLIDVAESVVEEDVCRLLSDLEDERGSIPAPLQQAILLQIGTHYASREGIAFGVQVHEIPSYKHLVGLYRNYSG